MNIIKREITESGATILIEEASYLFGLIKKKTKYIATRESPKGYWNWRKLPNRKLVPDFKSFELNHWNRDFMDKHIKN